MQEPTNNVFDKEVSYHDILVYLLRTMPTIAPEYHYVLMRAVDMSAVSAVLIDRRIPKAFHHLVPSEAQRLEIQKAQRQMKL